jgi:hypothetical protein
VWPTRENRRSGDQFRAGLVDLACRSFSGEVYEMASSTGPSNAALKARSSERLLIADEHTAIFGLEATAIVPVPKSMFDEMASGASKDTEAQPVLAAAKDALDTIVGGFALYQFPRSGNRLIAEFFTSLSTRMVRELQDIARRCLPTTSSHSSLIPLAN